MAAFLKMRVILSLSTIAVLLVLSFFRFSAYHYPFLDSDMAIHVLMARGFEFYHNLYYWGQTRLGSLLPLVAFFPWKVGLNPLKAVSLAQYGMVVVTLVGFFLLERRWLGSVVLVALFLLPPPALVYTLMPGHPALPHIMLTVLGAYAVMRVGAGDARADSFWFLTSCLCALLAVWVSDLAMVTAPVLWVWMVVRVRIRSGADTSVRISVAVVLATLSLPLWVAWLKSGRVDYSGYDEQSVAGLMMAGKGLTAHLYSLLRTLMMKDGFRWSGLWAGFMVLATGLGVHALGDARRRGMADTLTHPSLLFLLLAALTYAATMMSGWAALNGYDSRYLAVPVVFLMMSLCMMLTNERPRMPLVLTLVIAVIASGLSFGEQVPHPDRFQVNDEARDRLRAMRSATILGDYWFCYAMAAYNADEIIAMPFEKDFYRNGHQIEAAFLSDSIFVCTSTKYPKLSDTLHQHGRMLLKTGEPHFQVGNAVLARYTVQL
jgi:hypothetical protein